ncbi:MAG TPA: SIS domain-containing protein, partial [Elusimicrobiales bacterium]|nr:SIS domain-containing protein [Elusimicrobiales bacterium]
MNVSHKIDGLIETLNNLKTDLPPKLETLSEKIISSFTKGGKLLIMGNGGSASDAQHLAAEFVGRFKADRRPLPAIALTCNTSIITSVSNDFSFDEIFSRQIEALANDKDVVIAISTSGNSKNVIEAVKTAKSKG